jgi:hypothetical protein
MELVVLKQVKNFYCDVIFFGPVNTCKNLAVYNHLVFLVAPELTS